MLRDELTSQEYELAGLLTLGYTFAQIAFVVDLKQGYVKKRFYEMYGKIGASDKLELANRFAREVFMGYDEIGAVPDLFPKQENRSWMRRVRIPPAPLSEATL